MRRVGALVVRELAAHAEQLAVIVERGFEVPILVALLHRGQKVLAAILDPFDGPAQFEACRRDRDLFRIHDEFRTKAAADVGRDHAHLVLVEPQQRHQERPHLVRELGRRP